MKLGGFSFPGTSLLSQRTLSEAPFLVRKNVSPLNFSAGRSALECTSRQASQPSDFRVLFWIDFRGGNLIGVWFVAP